MTTAAHLAVPLTHLTELETAEACLRADLTGRDEEWAAAASGLPDWTRAQVVGHLAGSARGLVNLCEWASTGDETAMYASPEARATEIDRLAALPWSELTAQVEVAGAELRDRLATLTEPLVTRSLRLASGARIAAVDLAAVRIREIEIHRVDLAAEYQPVDWSTTFTLRTLGQLTSFFRDQREVPACVLRSVDSGRCWEVGDTGPDLLGIEADLLAWLVGRAHGPLRTSDDSLVPAAPRWV